MPAAPAFPAQAVPALALVGAAGAQSPAEAALRWRLCAARIDNIIVYGVYFLFCLGAHLSPIAPGSLIVLALLSVVYHFLFEAHSGQTIGKRRYGIQVRDVDGGPAEPKAIALRSALRIVDQLPIFYLSGLVSMVRTGPHRRQRIGDVVGRTTVVAIGGRAVTRGTPSWYLPLATATALVLSVLGVLGTVNARTAPLSPLQRTQFLNGCEAASPTLDCECLLSQLQASGYSSLDRLQGLFREQEQATAAGRPASGPPDLLGALRVCRP